MAAARANGNLKVRLLIHYNNLKTLKCNSKTQISFKKTYHAATLAIALTTQSQKAQNLQHRQIISK